MLLLNNKSRDSFTSGELVNIMNVDVNKIVSLLPKLSVLWYGPLQIIASLCFLYRLLGIAAFAGKQFPWYIFK